MSTLRGCSKSDLYEYILGLLRLISYLKTPIFIPKTVFSFFLWNFCFLIDFFPTKQQHLYSFCHDLSHLEPVSTKKSPIFVSFSRSSLSLSLFFFACTTHNSTQISHFRDASPKRFLVVFYKDPYCTDISRIIHSYDLHGSLVRFEPDCLI